MLLEQLTGLGARAVGLLDRLANAVPPLVDRLLDRAEGEPLEDENVIAKQMSVQIISPGTTSIRPPELSSWASWASRRNDIAT